ncbi:MAG: DUF3795 domain-containing protein [Prevotella sp.]|nr:DUF3795 domain-containing protein [Prevotella sp.]
MSNCVSRCGLDCESCVNREECDCPGCPELEEGNWAGDCEIKKCCENKLLEHCGLCPAFPCDLLRNTAFDPDEGDDGERLITLKRWAEEEPSARRKAVSRPLCGLAVGIAAGAVLGAFTGGFGAMVFACALVGTAIGLAIDISSKNKL